MEDLVDDISTFVMQQWFLISKHNGKPDFDYVNASVDMRVKGHRQLPFNDLL
jgi:hypothetical protein